MFSFSCRVVRVFLFTIKRHLQERYFQSISNTTTSPALYDSLICVSIMRLYGAEIIRAFPCEMVCFANVLTYAMVSLYTEQTLTRVTLSLVQFFYRISVFFSNRNARHWLQHSVHNVCGVITLDFMLYRIAWAMKYLLILLICRFCSN